jgi:hypothetical protein
MARSDGIPAFYCMLIERAYRLQPPIVPITFGCRMETTSAAGTLFHVGRRAEEVDINLGT